MTSIIARVWNASTARIVWRPNVSTPRPKGKIQELTATCAEKEARLDADYQQQWRQLETDWKTKLGPLYETVAAAGAQADKLFPPWQPEIWENWRPPVQFADAAKFARLDVDVEKLSEGLPKDARLTLPGPPKLSLPLLLTYPNAGSVVLETNNTGRDENLASKLGAIVAKNDSKQTLRLPLDIRHCSIQ